MLLLLSLHLIFVLVQDLFYPLVSIKNTTQELTNSMIEALVRQVLFLTKGVVL